MTSITINLTRQARHWQIQFAVNGQIEPRAVFGCTQGLEPMLAGFEAAETEACAIFPGAERDVRATPPTVTVGMPSGRVLTFTLTSLQDTTPELPQPL